ncbi:hypothetical protein N7478_011632 [Penicillium angulare]|uniref:uncharacterized protein n=1 Tax=Penicillium angulare TaxID=116970 RepID=UPI0025409E45|nr:uncharacterized protein N7478_011632 [Penicillium angulare]KAJ5261037.1 hypothetical protein N7478_011632 [Penicillium angulare]
MRFGYMIAFLAATVAAMPRGEIKQDMKSSMTSSMTMSMPMKRTATPMSSSSQATPTPSMNAADHMRGDKFMML